jgi:small subunit ribosomal protein S5
MSKERQLKRGEMLREKEFEQRILDLARVTRVTRGGKRLRFRAFVLIGDKKGKVGWGLAKGADVAIAVNKAVKKARKKLVSIPMVNETITKEVRYKFCAAKILIKPAPKGTGIKAGGAIRAVFELAGVPNVVGKILGSNNKINNARAVFEAIKRL